MNEIKTLRKATFAHIESELYSYQETLKEIEFLKEEILFSKSSTDENTGGGRGSTISKPTERTATRLLTNRRLTNLTEITNAIEKVYTGLPPDHQRLVRAKYWTRPQLKTWDGIAKELHINRATAFRWRDQIIYTIAEVLGWR